MHTTGSTDEAIELFRQSLLATRGAALHTMECYVGDVRRFKNGRRLASYLGLTPKETSSGNRRRLGRISKQGDPYLRHLLIHGARSMLRAAATKKEPDRLRSWALAKAASRGKYKATVAVANKLARMHGLENAQLPVVDV